MSWLDYWPDIEVDQDRESLSAKLATLRADVERMAARLRATSDERIR